jgi:hypothetical protein
MDNPDTTNTAVVASGVDVTVSVPTGLPVSSGRTLTTLPDVDRNWPVCDGTRGNEKKSVGSSVVKRSGSPAPFRRETPTRVVVGVTASPMADVGGIRPGVVKLKDVTTELVKGNIPKPGGSSAGNVS